MFYSNLCCTAKYINDVFLKNLKLLDIKLLTPLKKANGALEVVACQSPSWHCYSHEAILSPHCQTIWHCFHFSILLPWMKNISQEFIFSFILTFLNLWALRKKDYSFDLIQFLYQEWKKNVKQGLTFIVFQLFTSHVYKRKTLTHLS